MKYTEQRELDLGNFGARWACYFCLPINAAEHTESRKATEEELDLIVGKAFRRLTASMANYKHHVYVRPKGQSQPNGWSQTADPEWHYLVENMKGLVSIVEEAMRTRIMTSRYQTAVMTTKNGDHYCLLADKTELINPDPSLTGTISKYLPLV